MCAWEQMSSLGRGYKERIDEEGSGRLTCPLETISNSFSSTGPEAILHYVTEQSSWVLAVKGDIQIGMREKIW